MTIYKDFAHNAVSAGIKIYGVPTKPKQFRAPGARYGVHHERGQ